MNIDEINAILAHKGNLEKSQASFAMDEILNGRVNEQQLGLFITLLHDKGETADELCALVETMWDNSPKPDNIDTTQTLDTCGTGGDKSGTFNISTAVSLCLAGVGVKIAKHGNRAASSKCGAADVLQALGISVDLSVEDAASLFRETGFTFLFAPTYHPGMRFAAPVRKALGVPTTFNFLGPLANPYHAPYRMHGISKPEMLRVYIETLKELGVRKALVFHGDGGIDEIATSGKTSGFLLDNNEVSELEIDPHEFNMEYTNLSELVGGDDQTNASIINAIFSGNRGPARDIVVLNAAFGYHLVKGDSIEKSLKTIGEALDSGLVLSKVDEIREISTKLAN